VTPAERIATALAERFDVLDAPAMVRVRAFRAGATAALAAAGSVEAVVREVASLGELSGARDPHRVIVARLRQVPALVADRTRLGDELAESRRWAALDMAARRGETLRALVDRGALFANEAADTLRRELADDDLRAVALAVLEGDER